MISVRSLSKRYGYRLAVRQLDLSISRGELVGLLGPNGAGKSTLLRLLAGLARPTAGAIELAGLRLPEQSIEARALIGYVGHQPLLYEDLSAEQNLAFFARLYGIENPVRRVDQLLGQFELEARRREPLRGFSRGLQQRVALARALLHKPRILLLDEPHNALDLASSKVLDEMLRAQAKGGATILFATHDLDRAAALANRIEVMDSGRIASSLKKAQLKAAKLPALYLRSLKSANG